MEAVIFVGLQASGKSSFYLARFFRTHVRLNLDMLKTRHRLDVLLRACIEAKQPFVIDNTNAAISERAPYIALAKAGRFRVTGYYFDSSFGDCLRRNETREPPARIPAKGIVATYQRLQVPTVAEGFDQLCTVRIAESGEFIVEGDEE
jgi:predicted kinase